MPAVTHIPIVVSNYEPPALPTSPSAAFLAEHDSADCSGQGSNCLDRQHEADFFGYDDPARNSPIGYDGCWECAGPECTIAGEQCFRSSAGVWPYSRFLVVEWQYLNDAWTLVSARWPTGPIRAYYLDTETLPVPVPQETP